MKPKQGIWADAQCAVSLKAAGTARGKEGKNGSCAHLQAQPQHQSEKTWKHQMVEDTNKPWNQEGFLSLIWIWVKFLTPLTLCLTPSVKHPNLICWMHQALPVQPPHQGPGHVPLPPVSHPPSNFSSAASEFLTQSPPSSSIPFEYVAYFVAGGRCLCRKDLK